MNILALVRFVFVIRLPGLGILRWNERYGVEQEILGFDVTAGC